MTRKHTGITLAPKRGGFKKLLWGLAFLALLVWVIKNPYQAGDAVHGIASSVSTFVSALGGR